MVESVKDMDVSIIIVNWNTCELLQRCLTSIQTHRGDLSVEVIVVDNASSDDSVEMVRREFPWVRLIVSSCNLGYTGGNNLGAREAGGRYLLILNPDTELVGDALSQMVAYMEAHPHVGVVGPMLRYPDGRLQPSRRHFPTIGSIFFDGVTPGYWQWAPRNNRFRREYYMRDGRDAETQAVDWLVGAALLIRREAWEAVGPFDEQFFMYFDEVDWCRRCHQAGWQVHYLPSALVIHHEKGASRQVATESVTRIYRSKVRYVDKHLGKKWGTIVRLFFLFAYVLMLAEDILKWTVGHKRTMRRQRIRYHWQVLRSGLR